MTNHDKRVKPRIDSHNLVSYVCLDENNRGSTQGIGRTLDVGEGGIRLETHVPMVPKKRVSLTIGLEEDLMDVHGKVVYCKKREDGKYETGIQFSDTDEEKLVFLRQYIIIFREDQGG